MNAATDILRIELFDGPNEKICGTYCWTEPMTDGWQERVRDAVYGRGARKGDLLHIYKGTKRGTCCRFLSIPTRVTRVGE